jgi:hypothetical protein
MVTPAALTVAANNAGKTYDGQAFSGGNGVSYTGFVNGETAGVLGGTLIHGGTAQGAVNAGSYVIAAGGYTASNYTLSYAPSALTVTPAALTVTANSTSKAYDGQAFSGGREGWSDTRGRTVQPRCSCPPTRRDRRRDRSYRETHPCLASFKRRKPPARITSSCPRQLLKLLLSMLLAAILAL